MNKTKKKLEDIIFRHIPELNYVELVDYFAQEAEPYIHLFRNDEELCFRVLRSIETELINDYGAYAVLGRVFEEPGELFMHLAEERRYYLEDFLYMLKEMRKKKTSEPEKPDPTCF